MNTKVKLVKGSAVKLDRGSKYLIMFDNTAITKADVAELSRTLHREGYQAIMVGLEGSPTKQVKIIEES